MLEAAMGDDRVTREFGIGLVLAGAVSAGAYTAGVLDFLTEALDAYYAEREKPEWAGPRHGVSLRVISGASAGGMTAAMACAQLHRSFTHIRKLEDAKANGTTAGSVQGSANPLYSAWVQWIDIARLLELRDLQGGGGVGSVLDSTALPEIATNALGACSRLPDNTRLWLSPKLDIRITMTNLRGIPYRISLSGDESARVYRMDSHADYGAFAVTWTPPDGNPEVEAGVVPLDPRKPTGPNWQFLAECAIASGAFPIGLKARPVTRDANDYNLSPFHRFFRRAERQVTFDGVKGTFCTLVSPIQTDFDDFPPSNYSFVAVDGGVIDNEPLEIARRVLAGQEGSNPRDGDKAERAIILVDPFPNQPALPQNLPSNTLVDVIPALYGSLIDQARFKPEELQLAFDEAVFSRFAISPSRRMRSNPAKRATLAIACGALGGFGGFLHESFRRHDYLLGRANCQAFLKRWFALPETNPLFDAMKAGREQWYVKVDMFDPKAAGTLRMAWKTTDKEEKARMLPIIPLVGALADDIVLPAEADPRPSELPVTDLRRQIDQRISQVGHRLIDVDLARLNVSWAGRKALQLGFSTFLRGRIVEQTMAIIERELVTVATEFEVEGPPSS
jgi:Patatin-like phospholipase